MAKGISEGSPNVALRNDSFRNYADYMFTPEFERAIAELIEIAEQSRAAYMCAERVYFRCHACWYLTGWYRTGMRCCTLMTKSPRSHTR